MNKIQKMMGYLLLGLLSVFSSQIWAEQDEHGHADEAEYILLTQAQIQQAGIRVIQLKPQRMNRQLTALGEVKLNQYKTIKVSPTLTTRVEIRHVQLGDAVEKDDLLVTLHTIATTDISANVLASADLMARAAELAATIAEARGDLAIAAANWDRLRGLGPDAVSGKRYTAAKIAKEQAEARLKGYGRSLTQIQKLLASDNEPVQKHYELRAEQAGIIIKDDFVLGQVVTPEDVLFEISDMDHLWVEASMKPNDVSQIADGAPVTIQAGKQRLHGRVINIGRVLDEQTRTLAVRIEVETGKVTLYPGQFVKINLLSLRDDTIQAALSVPAEALLRGGDGDWILFVETAPGRFEPREIEILDRAGDAVVIEGVEQGLSIVSKGAFTLQSELAKSGFSVHNH